MKDLKSNRAFSYIIIAVIYLLCYAVGVISFIYLPFSMPVNLFIADTFATIVCFIFSVIFKNSSVYDPYWSVAPLFIVITFAIFSKITLLSALLLGVLCIWGVRLTANWAYTFKNLYHQDWRYTMLNEKTGKIYPAINFLGIHYFPTIVVYFCVLPAVFAIKYSYSFNYVSLIFIIISLLAVILQGVSDCQMHSFRKIKRARLLKLGFGNTRVTQTT